MAEPPCLASDRDRRFERQDGNLVVRRRIACSIGFIGLEAGKLSRRRQGRGWLSSAERRLPRRSTHERQTFRRAKNLLEPRLRRRQRLYSCTLLRADQSKRPSGGKRTVWSKREGTVMSLSPLAGITMASAK